MQRREDLQNGEVGEIMNESAKVRLSSSVFFPLLREAGASSTDDLHWSQELRHLEAGGENNNVELRPFSAVAHNTRLVNLANAFLYYVEILSVQSFEVAWIKNTALAAC